MTAPVMTWGGVHVGDTVRGADAGVWVVVERDALPRWVNGGEVARYGLQCGARRVSIERPASDPAPIIACADHRAIATAAREVWAAFPETALIREVLDDMPPRKKAAAPAAQPTTVPGIDGQPVAALAVADTVTPPVEPNAYAYLSGASDVYAPGLAVAAVTDVPGAPQAATPAPDGGTGGGALVTGPSTPANPDPFAAPAAVKREPPRGQYGWYKLPHPLTGDPDALFPRVSTIAKTLDDQSGLNEWKLRKVARGMGLRPDLVARAAASDIDEKQVYAEIVKSALEASATKAGAMYGSAVHRFVERLDAGESMKSLAVPAELRADIEAYARTLKESHLSVVPNMTERVVVNPEHNYAGQWDRPYVDRAGDIRIGDLKTGADVLEYGSLTYGAQQALYVHATHLVTPDFTGYEPTMPVLATDKALIIHLPIGKGTCQIYAIDIIKGWRAAMLSFHARAIRSDARSGWMWAYAPASPEAAVQLRIGRATTLDELMTAGSDAKRIGAWNAEMEAYALARYDVIRVCTAPDRAALGALWSELRPAGRWTQSIADSAALRLAQVEPAQTPAA